MASMLGVRFQEHEDGDDVYMLASCELSDELSREMERVRDPKKISEAERLAGERAFEELASEPDRHSAGPKDDADRELDPKVLEYLRENAGKDFDELVAEAEADEKAAVKGKRVKKPKPKKPAR